MCARFEPVILLSNNPFHTHTLSPTQAVIVSAMPPLVLGMLPILLASAYVGWAYQKSAQELKRLDSVTRSPIYSHFAESVAGLATIRAFQQQRAFVRESGRRVDANDRVYHHLWCANRWLALRLQLLGSTITGCVHWFGGWLSTLDRDVAPKYSPFRAIHTHITRTAWWAPTSWRRLGTSRAPPPG